MAVRVDAQELRRVLSLTPPEQNVMLVGAHGIGKSQIISQFYGEIDMPVRSFFLGQMSDPGDLIGLLHKNEETGRSEFLPPYWWPLDDQPIVLFLDELNRARPEILQAVMELTLNKTLAGRRLPEGSVIVSAVNDGDEYQLTDLDPALISRFNLYEFSPTLEDWLRWAERSNIDARVIQFIENQPQYLDGTTSPAEPNHTLFSGLTKTPDRRAWERVSIAIDRVNTLTETHIKLIAGIVGTEAANAFRRSLPTTLSVAPGEVLLEFSQHRIKIEQLPLSELCNLNEQIMIWISSGKCPDGKAEIAHQGMLSYIDSMRQRKLDEAVAHLVALVGNPMYEAAMEFVSESLELTERLTQYMDGIRIE